MATPYTISLHHHRLAAWAACRAASVKEFRFKVSEGVKLLASCKLDESIRNVEDLPQPTDFDAAHFHWREQILAASSEIAHKRLSMTHGIAAKLINVYLKVRFIGAWQGAEERVACLHPPIDSLLLDGLYRLNIGGLRDEWRLLRKTRWSKFSSQDYERAIALIRRAIPGRPLWEIEEHWPGYR